MAILEMKRDLRRLTAAEVVTLADADALPTLPAEVEAMAGPRQRPPTLAEIESLEWYAIDAGGRITGIMALRDTYDLHSNSDVLRVEYLAGSGHSCSRLLSVLKTFCIERGRRAIGEVDMANESMRELILRRGFDESRIGFAGGL